MSSEETNVKPPPRVLACALCSHRKLKCERIFPCGNCRKANAECVPVTAPRQRRRRFQERQLLDRVRYYEDLLRKHRISFEPLHPASASKEKHVDDVEASSSRSPRSDRPAGSSRRLNLWHAMSQTTLEDEDYDEDDESGSGFLGEPATVREAVIKKAWDMTHENARLDALLFASPSRNMDLLSLHPDPGKMLKLWQIYCDNVNPLLKVTHTPTLQARIIDAAGDVANISPNMEALLFAIYSVSVLSLSEGSCLDLLGTPKKHLLDTYRSGCQQALSNSKVLRNADRECLTALYLYLIAVRSAVDAYTLSSMLGIAIRIAQRMGIHLNTSDSKFTSLEAELRRRLWWSLVMFDNRISEMVDYKTATLSPTWDCCIPINLSDFEIHQEMKTLPPARDGSSEALFAVVRSELGNFLRSSDFHLSFTNPTLKGMNGNENEPDSTIDVLTKRLEDKYLSHCNAENPLDFMTIWTARGLLAKFRLLQHYSRHATSSAPQTDAQRNIAVAYALDMIDCDTRLMDSPLTKGYLWFTEFHFPLPAYIHVLQDLRRRRQEQYADMAWECMSSNYKVRMKDVNQEDWPFFTILSRLVLSAWEAQEALARERNQPLPNPPQIVAKIRDAVMMMASNFRTPEDSHQQQRTGDIPSDNIASDFSASIPIAIPTDYLGPMPTNQGGFPLMQEQVPFIGNGMEDMGLNDIDWSAMHTHGWF